ncbi:hypothetical protein [Mesorhizobium sp.]|uniref:hypothetical protein n=1 Tax=Mesorhizobium sp. TaxID=1871066 RepID=UPI000FE9F0E5|nr:hypothetical protein [Mesorhizobium sp.]RWC55674.1 MAG: hypothetical protein EOS56_25775 [Mesorhizobium sp.]RWC60891.1 MAG: hypothetical protein EOS29_19425 [Mesorhizobium sp.]
MRRLVLAALLLAAPSAGLAQESLTALMCQAKPTRSCALDMAADAIRTAAPLTTENLPYGSMVEATSRAGRLDLALEFAAQLKKTDTIALADLIAAFARADRLADLQATLSRLETSETEYAFVIGPVLVELGREDKLAALLKAIQPQYRFQLNYWQVLGNLRAGRVAEAVKHLGDVPEAEREELAGLAAETLYFSGETERAKPMLPYLTSSDPSAVRRKAYIATKTKDKAAADAVLVSLAQVPPDDYPYVALDVICALAATGQWQKAIDLARTLPASNRAFAFINVAERARQPEVFAVIEKAMRDDPVTFNRDRMASGLVRALTLSGYLPVAQTFIDSATSDYNKEILITFAAAALAEAGKPSEALQLTQTVQDPRRKAWALWEVASKMTP